MKVSNWNPCETAIKLCKPQRRGLFIEEYQKKFIKPMSPPSGNLFYVDYVYEEGTYTFSETETSDEGTSE